MNLDLLITNADIYDGTGTPPVKGNVGVYEGKIVYPVKPDSHLNARHVIDAGGLALSPGFINIHGHSDSPLLVDGRLPSVLLQGITTEVTGNCGCSIAPLAGEMLKETKDELEKEFNLPVTWSDFDSLHRLIEEKGTSVNIISLVGHGTLRGSVMGLADRAPTEDELRRMKEELEKALRQGAFGFSTGLIYPPGSFAKTEELVELAKTTHEVGGIYTTHIRGEGSTLIEAIEEALTIGRESGVPVEISHLKAASESMWGKTAHVLEMIHQARSEGMFVQHDQYPYTMSATGLSMVLPDWVFDGGTEPLLARLRDKETREKIKQEVAERCSANGRGIYISSTRLEKNKKFEGRLVNECADEEGKDFHDFILDLLDEEEASVGAIYLSMCEDDVQRVMVNPYTSIGNDAWARALEGPLSTGKPHPRTYGTFPRVLGRYSRDLKLFPLEEAIRKMTSLPAKMLGLEDRGVIRNGAAADLVLFNPETVSDTATIQEPHRYPEGIEYVIVNGKIAAHRHEIFPISAGKVLHNPRVNRKIKEQELVR